MSKSQRTRAANAEKKMLRAEREAHAEKQGKIRKITAIVTSSVIGVFVAAVIIATAAYSIRMNSGGYLRNRTAASSADIDVDGAVMSYYFNDVYNTFVEYYGSYVSYYGLDTSLSLKSQKMSDGQTWFDYFMSGAKSNVEGVLALNEAAKADGVTLSGDEINAISTRSDRTDTGLYGRGVKRNDIFDAKKLEALAYKYQFMKQEEFTPTEDEIDAGYKASPEKYQAISYYSYDFTWSNETDGDGIVTKEDAKASADKLAEATGINRFRTELKLLLKEASPEATEDDISTSLENRLKSGAYYSSSDDGFSEWAFGGAAVGETKVIEHEGSSKYTVYMLASEPVRDESRTVNVRHILLTSDEWGSAEKAKAQAEKLLEQWKSGNMTEESFALLALAYSADAGSYYNGGLYENVTEGRMVASFNDWCFDESRQPGDTEIVETTYGYHVMYFVGDGLDQWQSLVADSIISGKFTELNSQIKEKYPVAFDDTVLEDIPG